MMIKINYIFLIQISIKLKDTQIVLIEITIKDLKYHLLNAFKYHFLYKLYIIIKTIIYLSNS